LAHGIKIDVGVDAQSDIQVGVPGDPLDDMWSVRAEQNALCRQFTLKRSLAPLGR